MQFTAKKSDLLAALGRVLGAVDKRSTLPVLSHVLMGVYLRGAVGFAATDLEIFAQAECPAAVPGAGGSVCIPADRLRNALQAIPAAEIEFTLEENLQLAVQAGDFRLVLSGLPAEEFPAGPDVAGGEDLATFAPDLLPRMIKAVSHAVCQIDSKNNLCGVHLREEEGRLTAVATDGHRLAIAGIDFPGAEGVTLTLPTRACRLLSSVTGTVEMRGDRTLARLCAPHTDITARLIEQDFPDFRRVVPRDQPGSLTVETAALVAALEACGVVSEDKAKSVTLEAAGELLSISALGPQGTARVTVPCAGGEGFRTGVNSRYLLQSLESLGDDEVFIKYGEKAGPLLLVPIDHTGWDERLEVLMPLRV